LGDLFSRLEAARADLEAQVEAVEAADVEGHAAGGAVVIRLNASLGVESVHIDPSIIDPADPGLLEDAVVAALRDALGRVVEIRSSISALAEPGLAGGLDLGGLVGNLDLEGLLAGVDLEGLMGSLGMGGLSALAGYGKPAASDGEPTEDEIDESADDEPEV
jgi:DNA-binding protein YbaB